MASKIKIDLTKFGRFALRRTGRTVAFVILSELADLLVASAADKPVSQIKSERKETLRGFLPDQEIVDEIIRETFGRAKKRLKEIGIEQEGLEDFDFSEFPDIAFAEGRADIARGREGARRARIRRGSAEFSRTIFG